MAFTTSWSVTDLGSKVFGSNTNITSIGIKCTVTEGSYKGEWTSKFSIGIASTTAAPASFDAMSKVALLSAKVVDVVHAEDVQSSTFCIVTL